MGMVSGFRLWRPLDSALLANFERRMFFFATGRTGTGFWNRTVGTGTSRIRNRTEPNRTGAFLSLLDSKAAKKLRFDVAFKHFGLRTRSRGGAEIARKHELHGKCQEIRWESAQGE